MADYNPSLHYSANDFETASIRSAAPSYVSEVPSYHTTVSNGEPIPPYSPPANNASTSTNTSTRSSIPTTSNANIVSPNPMANPIDLSVRTASQISYPTLLPSNTAHYTTPGLPPIPPAPNRSLEGNTPSLGAFRIPSWSIVNMNPTYQRVATRRAQAAASTINRSPHESLRSAARALERVNEEEISTLAASFGDGSSTPTGLGPGDHTLRIRPLEDPYLVGEVAAARARRERLARENGDHVLHREDSRWDWFLAQQRDYEERERSWRLIRRSSNTSGLTRGRLARRLAAGGR